MDSVKLRAWYFHRQGLDGSLSDLSPAQVFERTGWSRSVGGANPYLALFARTGASRASADKSLADCAIHELPSARGCTYVVPQSHFALALTVGRSFGEDSNLSTAIRHLGVTEDQIDRLASAVCDALEGGPKDPRALRDVLGDQVRSFGEEGKKRGVTSDLPLALGRLQGQGRIRRIPVNGRLDNQRYAYALWQPSPFAAGELTQDTALHELANLYFQWIGPATVKEFQWLSGLGVKAAKTIVDSLDLVDVGDGRLMHRADAVAYEAFAPPAEPCYSLVGSLDNLSHLRLGLKDLIAAEDSARLIPGEKSLINLTGLTELVSHGIYDRGRLIGVWDFDPESNRLVTQVWAERTPKLAQAIDRTEEFVQELGDARTFSLDSPESRKGRLAMLKNA